MLFLVKGKVQYTPYMNDSNKPIVEIRLVEALTDSEAKRKFINHFDSQGERNGDSYRVLDVEVDPTIV